MKNFKTITDTFEKALEILQSTEEAPLKKSLAGIELCNKTLSRMKKKIEADDFETIPEEIDFFKHTKPLPMASLIYFTEVRSCELQKPRAGKTYQREFLENEIRKANKFFYRNADFVYYMELGHTYLDHQFFSRTNRDKFPITPLADYYQYPEFSTSHDMLWSKVKAMYRYLHYIRESLENLQPGINEQKLQPARHKVLVWTASKAALIELIYALYSDKVLNHGAADLATITASFENFFNIKLDQLYKTYAEIKERKGSRTKFLEELMIHLRNKMDGEEH